MRSFRDFMAEKVREYYTSEGEKIGPFGDFFTAPELDRSFGRAIAEFLQPYLRSLEGPAILELGAGRGLMAYDPELLQREGSGTVREDNLLHIRDKRTLERYPAIHPGGYACRMGR